MKRTALVLALVLLSACRGEPVPRDYQNAPPGMTDPPKSKAETPSGHAAQGTAGSHQTITPPETSTTGTTVSDTPPVTRTNT